MTPHEEVFSRRGGVKLILMELEQLRETLKQALPTLPAAAALPAGAAVGHAQAAPPGSASVPEALAQAACDQCKSKFCRASDVGWNEPAVASASFHLCT